MIILNYCNLIATSRHRAETSSRGRGRAGAEAGSGVAAGRPCSIGPSGATTCARGEPGEREPQLPGGGIGIRPSGATQLGLAVGSWCFRGCWSPAWALCWLPGMARAPWPRGRGQGRQLGCVGPDPEQADIKRRCCLRVCVPDSHNCDFAPLPAPLVFSRWQSEPGGACRGELITVVRWRSAACLRLL